MKEEKYIELSDGNKIYCQIKETGASKWIIQVHGIGEHLGRHSYLSERYSGHYNIFQFDLRGHGKSQGRRGYIDNFEQFYSDLDELIDYLKKTYGLDNYLLYGHSMGGLIVCGYLKNYGNKQIYPQKVYLSSPAIAAGGVLGSLFHKAPFGFTSSFTKLPLGIPLKGLVDLKMLSHDQRVAQDYINDDFCILAPHSKLLFNLVKEMRVVFSSALGIRCPLFCSIGSEDVVVNYAAVLDYFSKIETNCKLKIIKEAYHEVHNEIARYRDDFFKFLDTSLLDETS